MSFATASLRVVSQGLIAMGLLAASGPVQSLSTQADGGADREAIIQVALDYIEGWYEGDPERMARAVHADLAKRIAMPDANGVRRLEHMGKETLVEYTSRRQGQSDVDLRERIKVLDAFEGAAVVRVDADEWVDYLQIAKVEGDWVIINVLWELRPQE